MTHPLTPKQAKVLEIFKNFVAKNGFEPTLTILSETLKMNLNGVVGHLKALERKGHLRRMTPNKGPYKLAPSPSLNMRSIPLVSEIAAGYARETFDAMDQEVDLPKNVVAVRVRGDSMSGDGIFNGDFALIAMDEKNVKPKDILAVRVGVDEVTLKRIKKHTTASGVYYDLIPSNTEFKTVQATHIEILGKMVGLIRKF